VEKGVENIDLPDDLRALIEETVEDKEKQDSKKDTITVSMLTQFFDEAVKALDGEVLSKTIDEKLDNQEKETQGGEETEQQQHSKNKLTVIKKSIEAVYVDIWETKLEVDADLGREAMTKIDQFLQSDKISGDELKHLETLLEKFGAAEHRMVGSKLLGEEEYNRRQAENKAVMDAQRDIVENLNSLDAQEKSKYILGLKEKGDKLRKKMTEMGQEAALDYMDNMSEEDAKTLRQLSALTRIMQASQGGGHGHSHNGQPCTGHGHASHGHAHEAESHGHSHDGKPCGGHGHSHAPPPKQSHGHSHNGKPCGGHGHSH